MILVKGFMNHILAENTYFTNHAEWLEHWIMAFINKPENNYQIILKNHIRIVFITNYQYHPFHYWAKVSQTAFFTLLTKTWNKPELFKTSQNNPKLPETTQKQPKRPKKLEKWPKTTQNFEIEEILEFLTSFRFSSLGLWSKKYQVFRLLTKSRKYPISKVLISNLEFIF